MAILVGLDIGTRSVKLAAIGEGDGPRPRAPRAKTRSSLFPIPFGDRIALVGSAPVGRCANETARELLHPLRMTVRDDVHHVLGLTGAGARSFDADLPVSHTSEVLAVARTISLAHPDMRTVIEIGGESSMVLHLEPVPGSTRSTLVDFERSGECAAGTGSFLEHQARRLGFRVEEIGEIVLACPTSARIAGRCSVFAETDMVHAQQSGSTPAEVLRGLCDAIAINVKAGLLRGRRLERPVGLIGGVARNVGVRQALRRALELEDEELIFPDLHAWCGALGAALLASERGNHGRPRPRIGRPRRRVAPRTTRAAPPLSTEHVTFLGPPPASAPSRDDTTRVAAYLGIDVGSVSTNVVAMSEDGEVVHAGYLRTSGRPIDASARGLQELTGRFGSRLDVLGVGTTGSGRDLIGEIVGADVVHDEITAHKTGAVHVSREQGGPLVDTIFEIGGQDAKFISLEDGVVVDFAMNEACAAGTGSFLEEQADRLGVEIEGEFARLALSSRRPSPLGERCTVFMERDVSTRLRAGDGLPDLTAGLAISVVLNYLHRVVRARPIGRSVFLQGGTAYNAAVAAAFAAVTGRSIVVPPHCGVMGAVGMALLARAWHRDTGGRTRFRGTDLECIPRRTRSFTCRGCTNECDVKEVTVEGERTYWGDRCADRFRRPSRTGRTAVIQDLVGYRDEALERVCGLSFASPQEPLRAGPPNVGIPRSLSTFDRLAFWRTYFEHLRVNLVLSPPTDGRLAARGAELCVAEPCHPVAVAHGHVEALLERGVDLLFLPNVTNEELDAEPAQASHLCPWNQTLPFVIASSPAFALDRERILSPTVHFQLGPRHVKRALAPVAARLGVRRRRSDRAVRAAYEAQQAFGDALLVSGRRALATLRRRGRPGVVLLGRSYNLYDRALNCDVPRKLRDRYGVNVLPLDFLVSGRAAVPHLHPNMYWASGRRILAAVERAGREPDLHFIYLTNFKCGPDSYLRSFARDVADAPLLTLLFDGHGNDAGYLTRCEAYLDSKGILRCFDEEVRAPGRAAPTRRAAAPSV